jgi:hypothetical protein
MDAHRDGYLGRGYDVASLAKEQLDALCFALVCGHVRRYSAAPLVRHENKVHTRLTQLQLASFHREHSISLGSIAIKSSLPGMRGSGVRHVLSRAFLCCENLTVSAGGNSVAGAIGGVLALGLLNIGSRGGLKGWQYLFLIGERSDVTCVT